MKPTTRILLRNNPRASRVLATALLLLTVLGLVAAAWGIWASRPIIAVGGVSVALLGCWDLWAWRPWWRTPRVSLTPDSVLVYLRRGEPWRVPLEVVECFFLGQAPSTMRDAQGQEVESRNVVIRLAERSSDWHQKSGNDRSLGRWCDGYITVYGIWCEPLDRSVVDRMNHQLAELKRTLKNAKGPASSAAASRPGAASP